MKAKKVEQLNKQLFIGGSGRSGTSLLSKIIGRHPEVLNFLETRVLDGDGIFKLMTDKIDFETFGKHILENARQMLIYRMKEQDVNDAQIVYSRENLMELMRNVFAGAGTNREKIAKFIQEIFSLGVKAANKKFWVEKTPHTIKWADELFDLYNDMRYVHVIRDPKEVYCSLLTRRWGPNNVSEFIKWYISVMQKAYQSQKKIPRRNYLVIELDEIVYDGNNLIKDIFEFMDIGFSDSIVNHCVSIVEFDQAHLRRWESELCGRDIMRINGKCMDIFSKWKYLCVESYKYRISVRNKYRIFPVENVKKQAADNFKVQSLSKSVQT